MTPPEARERLRAEARETVEFWSWTPGDRARDLITNLADALDEAEAKLSDMTADYLRRNNDATNFALRLREADARVGRLEKVVRQVRERLRVPLPGDVAAVVVEAQILLAAALTEQGDGT